jgi:hypothetical protein
MEESLHPPKKKGGSTMEVKKISLDELLKTLKQHYKKIWNSQGITPGDVKILNQDLTRVLEGPLPERATALLIKVLDMSPRGGRVWLSTWLERVVAKIEILVSSGLDSLEAGYAGLILEPSRVPGEGRQAAE